MRKFAVLALGVLLLTGCTRIEPGHVGIKLNLAGSDKGVEDLPLQTGWVFYNPFTQNMYEYPTYVQTVTWTQGDEDGIGNEEISFNSKEGMTITGDISLSYQLAAARVPAFFVKFRTDDLDTFTHGFMRNVARDLFNEVAGKYGVEEIYGPKKDEFLAAVREQLNAAVLGIGVAIEQFGFIGAPRIPQNVAEALNSKVEATQNAMRAENELRQATAEAKKRVAQAEGEKQTAVLKAEGEALANERLARSLTPQLMEWRRLQIQERAVDKWQGQVPSFLSGSGQGSFLFQMPEAKR